MNTRLMALGLALVAGVGALAVQHIDDPSDDKRLVGRWACTPRVSEGGDKYAIEFLFAPDGSLSNVSTMEGRTDGGYPLSMRVESTDHWKLHGDYLVMTRGAKRITDLVLNGRPAPSRAKTVMEASALRNEEVGKTSRLPIGKLTENELAYATAAGIVECQRRSA